MRGRFISGLLLMAMLAFVAMPALAQETTSGTIEGTVTDPQGEPLPGVTVEVTSTQGTKSTTTGGNGGFRFPYLTPGNYELRASLQGFITVERKNVDVRLGSRVRTEVVLTPGVQETIEVIGSAPVVNLTSSTTGANISNDLMQSVPVGRTFGETLALAPGVVDSGIDNSNPSIGGASGLENAYVVDGVNIGNTGYGSAGSYSIVFGSLGTGVNFDYIQEVQVKTGGYEPEFGEALGGFVNLITKSGGNTLKGSAYAYWQPEWTEGDREEFDLVNAAFDNTSVEENSSDIGFEVGGPLQTDKLFAYGSFNPSFEDVSRNTYDGYTEFWSPRVGRLVDNTEGRDRTIWNYAGNIKWFASPQHSLSLSAFGDPSKGDMGAQRNSAVAHLYDPEFRYSELTYGGHNVTGRWNGELMSNWFVEGSVAWHRDKFEEDLLHPELPGGTDQRVPNRFRDPNGVVGGVGFVGSSESENTQYRVKFSNFFTGGGEHNLRYGLEYQDIGYTNTADYSGQPGQVLLLDGGTRPVISTTGFSYLIRPTSFRVTRIRSNDDLTAVTDATYWAFYAYDSWNITPYVNVMAGIRYEEDKLNGNLTDFSWSDNWAPRFHLTWDPTRDNKTKLSFSWGRFFGKIPNDLAVRALSSEVTHVAYYDPATVDLSNPNNPQFSGRVPFFDTTFGDHETEIVEGSKVTSQDEWTLGAEREVIPFLNVGLTYINRRLNQTLEDYATHSYSAILDGTEEFGAYIIGNPDIDHPDLFPKPARKYDAVTLHANKRLHDRWQMLASYTWSRLEGNYEGFFRRDNGQSDPFITSLYDFAYLRDPDVWEHVINDGPLPNDRTHVFNLYGSYLWDNGLDLGLGLKVQSGLPITPLGWNEVYGNGGEIPLAPRGSAGRGDTVTQFDTHVGYAFNLGGRKLQVVADVFNLFNAQQAIDYNNDAELGCAGPGCEDPDFAKPILFQSPRQIRFAARFSF